MGSVHVARFYDSDVADAWKRQVALGVMQSVNVSKWALTEAPVAVELRFAMPRPKSHIGAKGLKPSAPQFHAGKPDVDNLAKLVLDQITKNGCIWRDDSQVVSLRCDKFWAVGNEHGCSVMITAVEL
jgi:Holliday junction resolvase RusA-like endonuclease